MEGKPSMLSSINAFFNNAGSPLTEVEKLRVASALLGPSEAVTDGDIAKTLSGAAIAAVVEHLKTARSTAEGA